MKIRSRSIGAIAFIPRTPIQTDEHDWASARSGRAANIAGSTGDGTTSPSFDRFLDETERIGVLDQRPHLGALKPARDVGFDLKPELHLAAWKSRELLDNRLNDLMDVPCRS